MQETSQGPEQNILDKIVGVWSSRQVFGPQARGKLAIADKDGKWTAVISGFEAPVQHDNSRLNFALPDGKGEFRGVLKTNSNQIIGHWIQPAGIANNTGYATPVVLEEFAERIWAGDVSPLDDSLTLHLVIRLSEDGSTTAFIRNPEYNIGVFRPFQVTQNGTTLTFANKRRANDRIDATYDDISYTLSMVLPDTGAKFQFKRHGKEPIDGFYPRSSQAQYKYTQPKARDDGWETASLTDAGLDLTVLSKLITQILNTETTDYTTPYIHGILIARHGKLALEEYFYGYDRDHLHDTRSAGKTFASVLVGLAIQHGAKFNVDTQMLTLFPDYQQISNLNDRKKKMTVRDLLTMTSGFACDDNNDSSPGNEDNMQSQTVQPDWYKYTLDLPMGKDPGGDQAVYCTAGINLLGGIVKNMTGKWVPEFFQEYFAGPMGIQHYHMNLTPTQDGYLGGGVYLRLRDQLKLGQLYLDHGKWNGHQVISEKWVHDSTTMHARFEQSEFEGPGVHGYGYAWHIREREANGKMYRMFSAEGNGGQLVIVIPDLDMVVCIAAGNYNHFPVWFKFISELLPQYIIPSVLS